MKELVKLSRLSLGLLIKEEENDAGAGRTPTVDSAPSDAPSVPAEEPERSRMSQPKPRTPQAIIQDAIRVLETGLKQEPHKLRPEEHKEIASTLQYMQKGDIPLSVKGIMKDGEGRILVLRDAYSDFWDLPGGHISEGETIENALRREILEEAGLEVGNVNQTETRMLELGGSARPVLFFDVEYTAGQPRISEEHIGFQWASESDLNGLNLGVFKDILIPKPDRNQPLEQDSIATKTVGPQQIPTYQVKDGDGGGAVGIAGAGDAMVSEDVHTPVGGGAYKKPKIKSLVSASDFNKFARLLKESTPAGPFVTGDNSSVDPPVDEIEERPVGNEIVKGIKLIKSIASKRLDSTDLRILSKASGKPFIIAGYASPVVIDQEGHRISHSALQGDLDRFMAMDGRYANVNLFHCLAPDTSILVQKKRKGSPWVYKRIDEIKEGDTVYSHKGRKCRVGVVSKFNTDEEIIRLELGNGEIIQITGDHKVLTTDGWLPAGKLTDSHVLMHSDFRKPHSEDTKRKISDSNKKFGCRAWLYGKDSEETKRKKSESAKKYGPRPYAREHMSKVGLSGFGARKTAIDRRGKTWSEVYGQEAADRMSAKLKLQRGEKHPNWRGGISLALYPYNWQTIRRGVLQRDGYMCLNCNITDDEVRDVPTNVNKCGLHVDHINSDASDNRLENLQSLCPSCHMKKTRADDKIIRSLRNIGEAKEKSVLSLSNGTKIKHVSRIYYKGDTYCLNVEEDHSYVGKGIVYHNSNLTVGKVIPEFTTDDGTTYKTQVDDIGLYAVAEIRTDPYAPEVVKDVIKDIEDGKLKSFSISGNADNPVFTCDEQQCFYSINKVNFFEWTVCLLPNEKIWTKDGLKSIIDVQEGEEVLTHLSRWRPVVHTMNRSVNEDIVVLETEDGVIRLTKNHFVRDRYDWIPVNELKVGDIVQVFGGFSKVKSISYEKYDGLVYNIEVEEDHSYVSPAIICKNCEEGVNQDAKFDIISKGRSFLVKAPPGPPPRPGLDWKEETSRWVCPVEGCEEKHDHSVSNGVDEETVLPISRQESRARASEQYRNSPDIKNVRNIEGVNRYYNFEYKSVNEGLRNGWDLDDYDQEIYEDMKDTMEPVKMDYTVFRGWRNNPMSARPKVGAIIASSQFTSTTLDSHYAIEWMGYNSSTGDVIRGNPLWKINVPKGTYGIMPQGVSNDYEVELTLDTNIRFKCVAVHNGEVKVGGPGEQNLYAQDIYELEVMLDE